MSLVNTLTQPLRQEYLKQLDKYERRSSRYGAWDLFSSETGKSGGILSSSDIAAAKGSFGNTTGVEIPVMDASTVTIGTTVSCTVPDSENTSNLVTLTFLPYSFGFTMTPAAHYQNQVNYEQDFAVKMKKYLLQMAADIDVQAIAALETDKNQFFPASILDFGYGVIGDALQIPQANKDDFYNRASAMMEQMDFYDNAQVVNNPIHNTMVNRFVNQGGGNSENQSFQFGGYSWNTTNRVTNNAGVESTAYIINEGSLATVNRNRPECINGDDAGDGTEWGIARNLPYINVDMGFTTKSSCDDRSALGGGASTASKLESFQFDTEIVLITSYNSNIAGSFGPVLKAEFLNV